MNEIVTLSKILIICSIHIPTIGPINILYGIPNSTDDAAEECKLTFINEYSRY